eukprot:9245059-Pyramimonas_sp.AAC.1
MPSCTVATLMADARSSFVRSTPSTRALLVALALTVAAPRSAPFAVVLNSRKPRHVVRRFGSLDAYPNPSCGSGCRVAGASASGGVVFWVGCAVAGSPTRS